MHEQPLIYQLVNGFIDALFLNVPSAGSGAATGAAIEQAAMERKAATTVVNFILTKI